MTHNNSIREGGKTDHVYHCDPRMHHLMMDCRPKSSRIMIPVYHPTFSASYLTLCVSVADEQNAGQLMRSDEQLCVWTACRYKKE